MRRLLVWLCLPLAIIWTGIMDSWDRYNPMDIWERWEEETR